MSFSNNARADDGLSCQLHKLDRVEQQKSFVLSTLRRPTMPPSSDKVDISSAMMLVYIRNIKLAIAFRDNKIVEIAALSLCSLAELVYSEGKMVIVY